MHPRSTLQVQRMWCFRVSRSLVRSGVTTNVTSTSRDESYRMNRNGRKKTQSVSLGMMIEEASEVATTMLSEDPRVLQEVLLAVGLMKETPEVPLLKVSAEVLTPERVMITEEAQAVLPPSLLPTILQEVTGEDEDNFHHH